MCGIYGVIHRSTCPRDASLSLAGRFAQSLRHRGPDDEAVMLIGDNPRDVATPEDANAGCRGFLGHQRLSILDVSAAGRQPMTSPDGRFTLVFNGEIYNYLELREPMERAGQRFETGTDTEVLLRLWSLRQADPLAERLAEIEGMYAFAVYDRDEQTVTCVRDPFGVKPLYLHAGSEGFSFASELPAMFHAPGVSRRVNAQRAYDYLVWGYYDFPPDTMAADVSMLPPGTLATYDLKQHTLSEPTPFWSPKIDDIDISFDEAAARMRELFLQSVRIHLRTDVPLGAALSGGIDSSAIVCAVREIEPALPIHTFSYVADDERLSESKWVDQVVNHIGADHHVMHADASQLESDIADLMRAQGEPFGGTSIYGSFALFRFVGQQGVKVLLEGQGADEMLAGYDGYPGRRVKSLVEQGRLLGAAGYARHASQWPGRSLTSVAVDTLGQFGGARASRWFGGMMGRPASPRWLRRDELEARGVHMTLARQTPTLRRRGARVKEGLAHELTRQGLGSMLRHGDRNAMRFSVENRVPFLTRSLADFSLSLPEQFLVSAAGESKSVFRAAMRGLVPDAILDRRDKVGFATPEAAWLKQLQPLMTSTLERASRIPFFDTDAMRATERRLRETQAGRNPQLWRWFNFIQWVELFDIDM